MRGLLAIFRYQNVSSCMLCISCRVPDAESEELGAVINASAAGCGTRRVNIERALCIRFSIVADGAKTLAIATSQDLSSSVETFGNNQVVFAVKRNTTPWPMSGSAKSEV